MARNRLISLKQRRDGISDGYSPDTLESLFHRAMVAIYDYVLLERRYDANRYLRLLESDGGVLTAKDFLNSRASVQALKVYGSRAYGEDLGIPCASTAIFRLIHRDGKRDCQKQVARMRLYH